MEELSYYSHISLKKLIILFMLIPVGLKLDSHTHIMVKINRQTSTQLNYFQGLGLQTCR